MFGRVIFFFQRRDFSRWLGELLDLIGKACRGWIEMQRERWMEASRDSWKKKAVQNATALREQRKALGRSRQRIEALRAEVEALKKSRAQP
jgi:hypothetical protein